MDENDIWNRYQHKAAQMNYYTKMTYIFKLSAVIANRHAAVNILIMQADKHGLFKNRKV